MTGFGVAALICLVFFLLFGGAWIGRMDNNAQADTICKKRGYSGGHYDPYRGVVCHVETVLVPEVEKGHP